MEALTEVNRYDAVSDLLVLHHQYPSGNATLDTSWRVFNYFNEMASGGHEGYLAWTISHLNPEEVQPFYDALIKTLKEIGAEPLADAALTYGVELWNLSRAFERGEITEDAYVEVLQAANGVYYQYEDTFRQQMESYAEKLFPQIFEIVD